MSMEETFHELMKQPYKGESPEEFIQGIADRRDLLRRVVESGGGGEHQEMLRESFRREDQIREDRGIGREN